VVLSRSLCFEIAGSETEVKTNDERKEKWKIEIRRGEKRLPCGEWKFEETTKKKS
jgi:hypothetical protein